MPPKFNWQFVRWVLSGALLVALIVCFLSLVAAGISNAHAQAIFADGFESAEPPDPCAGSIPDGFFVVQKTWLQTWAGACPDASPNYPNSIGSPVPLFGLQNRLVVTRWVPGVGESANVFWDTAQVLSGACYFQPKPAQSMYVSFSHCPGDVRPRGACGRFGQPGSLTWSTQFTGPSICTLTPGVAAYMTVMPYDPDTMEFQCPPEFPGGCDVQAVHRGL